MIIAISITLFFIVLRFAVTLFNFLSNPKLPHIAHPHNALVSILIPARDEEDDITALLQSIVKQDYHHYEVIVLDDNSTDNTYEICSRFADMHHNFKVIKGDELPTGWLGKNFACYQLAQHAKGQYFLFLDADEIVHNNLINSAVHRMQLRGLSLLSLFTNQHMVTFGEKAVVPLMHYILLNLLPLRLVYLLRNPLIAAASGQFMLFDAAVYRQYQWHRMVKDKIVEDVEIMKCVKSNRYNGETMLANGMITCRMYKSYNEAVSGFGKNFLAAFNYSIPGFLVYITVLIAGPLIVITTLNLQLILFMTGLILLTRIMIALSAGQNALLNVILHPLQMFNLVVIAFLSVQKHLTNTTVWKGRKV
ncbi:glycosyltransferase family 2 protein [Mucilaginibacter hurinus]|uniref:Glycosyltransferase family 2 protein n=1 Tax=Mucilaginibacter hurinus TaxID=2201324 RepID=A0A367GNH4_9SPHI|nr:glycosyltransferase [Mucilaginibacter hurinus]RCH55027.1 glycosyltransferase family 2 protein [Mucilaginibacter hurinus]